ncbi:hypothetical protein ABZ646_25945 [Streptomyces sp. NPDC007162]|uniref:hypothetical protein n=1 Tax=Streptomyces sp. NPDC007162 TaxID=3156917 RepID=UPI0033D7520D
MQFLGLLLAVPLTLIEQRGGDAVQLALDGVLGPAFGVLQQREQQQVHGGHRIADEQLPGQGESRDVDRDEGQDQGHAEHHERQRAGDVRGRLGEPLEPATPVA